MCEGFGLSVVFFFYICSHLTHNSSNGGEHTTRQGSGTVSSPLNEVCSWILKVKCGRVFPPPDHPSSVTSLGCSCRQRLLFHHASMPATRQARSKPAAKKQKMPAKLCSLRERPSGCVVAWLLSSHRPVLGHHFCFMMSRSPFSCSSKILEQIKHRGQIFLLTFLEAFSINQF